MVRSILIASCMLAAMFPANAADPRNLTCTGSLFDPAALSPSPMTVKLALDASKTTIDSGSGVTSVSITSNDKIQMHFTTSDFVGEYFHYTSDLFLMYKSERLARLTCSPM